jgi:hypothetical protein
MEVQGVARNDTAHSFSIQVKCYLGDVAETRVHTTMPQQLLCGVRAAGWQKVRLKFLFFSRIFVRCGFHVTPTPRSITHQSDMNSTPVCMDSVHQACTPT